MTTGVWVLLAAVVFAAVVGAWRAARDGRFRGASRLRSRSVLADTAYAEQLGGRATLLQFSSAFCAPCRATRRVLEDVAAVVPDVVHVEVDAEAHLDLVRRLGIARTPTTLVLDESGAEVARAAGAPTKQQVLSALAQTIRD